MSLTGSPTLLSPSSGTQTPVGLYRSAPEALHTSSAVSTSTSSPAHINSHSHSLSPSPRLTSSMLSAFLPGPGGALGSLGGLGSLSGLTPGSPGLVQTSSGAGLCSECKLVEVHGVKVASFNVDGQELICLPQVFDLFLKHLVGGLHTVYTKLKRLDITPVVCTVEQVRVLRGLGAIQPGVNRCKLISRKDFETLYQDCTSASGSGSVLFTIHFDPIRNEGSDSFWKNIAISYQRTGIGLGSKRNFQGDVLNFRTGETHFAQLSVIFLSFFIAREGVVRHFDPICLLGLKVPNHSGCTLQF